MAWNKPALPKKIGPVTPPPAEELGDYGHGDWPDSFTGPKTREATYKTGRAVDIKKAGLNTPQSGTSGSRDRQANPKGRRIT
jgi:hypothetical protein